MSLTNLTAIKMVVPIARLFQTVQLCIFTFEAVTLVGKIGLFRVHCLTKKKKIHEKKVLEERKLAS